MTIRTRLKADLGISSTTAEEKDLANNAWEAVTDALNEGGSVKVRVPAGTTDKDIRHPCVDSAKLLIIRTTPVDPGLSTIPEIRVKLNGGSEEVPILPMESTKQGFLVLTHPGITAVTVSNPGTSDMDVVVAVAGD